MDRNNIYPHCRAREKLNMPKDKNPSILQQQMTWWNSTKYCLLNNASQGCRCRCVLVSHLVLVVQRKRRDLQRHTKYADACDVRELSWECPGHALDLSICVLVFGFNCYSSRTLSDSCESHVQLKSLNLSHEQLDSSKSEKYWTKCKYFVRQLCLCTILECI